MKKTSLLFLIISTIFVPMSAMDHDQVQTANQQRELVYNLSDNDFANLSSNNQLLNAAMTGHLDRVRYAMQTGANPNEQNNNRMTALHCAILGLQATKKK